MSKFTKISAAALFALFLTACDKPAEKAAEPAKAQTPATTQVESPKAEEMKSAATEQGAQDFKKFLEWKLAQEQTLIQAQNELQQSVNNKDKAAMEAGLAGFKAKVSEVLKGLDALEIKDAEVNAFKADARLSLVLSNELIEDSVKAMNEPKPELQQAIQEKAQKLMQLGADLQQKQIELQKKFAK